MAEYRTKAQIEANMLDSDMSIWAVRIDDFAGRMGDAGLAGLARHIRQERLGVRIHMHPQDREATK